MIGEELWVFTGLAFTMAVLHSLNPDHWLPFVMMGRSRNWSYQRTLALAGLAGIAHVCTSIIIALIGVALGASLAERFTTIVEYITGSLLIVFGFGFAYLSWRRKGHHHHGIPLISRLLGRSTEEAEKYVHIHEHVAGDKQKHDKNENPNNEKIGYGLVAIIGLTPCVALLPILFAVTPLGLSSILAIMAVFLIVTIATILLLTGMALKGLKLVRLEFFEKHGEIITGLVIALIGILVVGLHLGIEHHPPL